MKEWLRGIDRTNALIALGVWIVGIAVYLKTMAPTITFWDCGEFIAVSYILGIPHPPGTPLYVLVGKVFTFNPFIAEPSARINFLSVLSSSFTTLFTYLCAVRLLRYWQTDKQDLYARITLYGGAAAGALFFAWSKTHWNNSTEAEVYGLSMLMFMGAVWLALKYYETSDQAAADRIMLAIVYIAFLGIGVHMTTFLVLPILALFFILKKGTPVRYWFMAATLLILELYLIFALSSRPNEVPIYLPLFIVFVIYLMYLLSTPSIPRLLMYIAGAWLVASVPILGSISTIIRSAGGSSAIPASGLLNIIGMIGFIALIVLGVIALLTYLRQRNSRVEDPEPELLTAALFILVASLMAGLLLIGVRGYSSFLFLSVILMGGLGLLLRQYIRWPILIAIAGVSLVMIGIYPYIWGSLAAAALVLVLGLLFNVAGWRAALLVLVMAAAGFSVHYFIWVRSAQKPYINENNPSQSWDQMRGFLERKQYGSQSMTERMFERRGEWENQFGAWRRMGYWGFFQNQYGINGRAFFAVFILGVLGLWEAIRRRSELGLALALLIIVSSIGLVLYMNFADGTRQDPITGEDYLEVRDRDYFFTPAYVLFGMAIGMGITALVQFIRDALGHFSGPARQVVLGSLLVLFLLPTFALAKNYYECDRSDNWIAHDYAKSLLSSADQNAAFFTYGDNDTFPLWCMQEAYKYRKDVKLVNLSLANTKWYIKQVQEYMGLDLGMTEKQIDDMRPFRTQDGRSFYLNNQVIDAIITHNRHRVPINFSITVANDARKYLGRPVDSHLTLSGLKWRLGDTADGPKMAVDEGLRYFHDLSQFQLRGIFDSTVYKDDNQLRLPRNFSNAMIMVADSLRKARRHPEAIRLLEYGYEVLPLDNELVNYLAGLYTDIGREDGLRKLLERSAGGDPKWLSVLLGRQMRAARKFQEAEATLNQVFIGDPTYRAAYEELCMLYNDQQNYRMLRATLVTWVKANPGDTEASEMLTRLDEFMATYKSTDTGK
ncbi:MAG: DUF2723 domain-containing protein [bacterium]|nr:DUF2723 domain-containing protein [bacterium]